MNFDKYSLTSGDLLGLSRTEEERLKAQMQELQALDEKGEHLKAHELKETIKRERDERSDQERWDER
jgi:hypothetical protein